MNVLTRVIIKSPCPSVLKVALALMPVPPKVDEPEKVTAAQALPAASPVANAIANFRHVELPFCFILIQPFETDPSPLSEIEFPVPTPL